VQVIFDSTTQVYILLHYNVEPSLATSRLGTFSVFFYKPESYRDAKWGTQAEPLEIKWRHLGNKTQIPAANF
jgi:hypothetical protein